MTLRTRSPVERLLVERGRVVGAPVPAGQKSLAYALTFQSDSKTLQDAEVAKLRQRIVRRLEEELGAVLRG